MWALPHEQQCELRGAAEELGIAQHIAVAAQVLYEAAVYGEVFVHEAGRRVQLGCTAVAIDGVDCPIHARTLDWTMPGVSMRDFCRLTVDLTFYRGGEELYQSTSIAGYLGVLTGVKPGCFSLSINFRKPFADCLSTCDLCKRYDVKIVVYPI